LFAGLVSEDFAVSTIEGLALPTSRADKAIAALLLLNAGTNAFDVFSALNSSPWTAENFGADPAKAKSCREYVYHSMFFTGAFGIAAGAIAQSWYPIIGVVIADGYMYWLYNRALKRGASAGSGGWQNG
jgi:hypothetical protein